MRDKLLKQTAIWVFLFTVVAMTFMVYYISTKPVVIIEDEKVGQENNESAKKAEQQEVAVLLEAGSKGQIFVPLKKDIKNTQIEIREDNYRGELLILLPQDKNEEGFRGTVLADPSIVEKVSWSIIEGKCCLRVQMTDFYEYKQEFEKGKLTVSLQKTTDLYDHVIVINPGHGGSSYGNVVGSYLEKDITMAIAQKAVACLEKEHIKAYLTRNEGEDPTDSERADFVEHMNADLAIEIHAVADADNPKIFGTRAVYNSMFFIPGFGNLQIADLLEREVVTKIHGKAIGLAASKSVYPFLENLKIPAAGIEVGYITNKQESFLLGQDAYQQKIAEGICAAVVKAYAQMEIKNDK